MLSLKINLIWNIIGCDFLFIFGEFIGCELAKLVFGWAYISCIQLTFGSFCFYFILFFIFHSPCPVKKTDIRAF